MPPPSFNVIRSASWLSAARLGSKALAFIAVVLVARYLGRAQFGQYSVVIALALVFSYLSDFGLVSLLIREISHDPERTEHFLSNALGAETVIAAVSAAGVVVAGIAVQPGPGIRLALVFAAIGLFIESLGRPFTALILAQKRFRQSAFIMGVVSSFNTVALATLVVFRAPLPILVGVAIPTGVVSLCLSFFVGIKGRPLPNWHFSRKLFPLLGRSLPFAALAGSAVLYDKIDVILLAHLSGPAAVGVYAGADRVADGLLVLPAALGAVLYPLLAATPAEAWNNVRAVFRWAVPIACVVTAVAIYPGSIVVGILFGVHYPGIAMCFRLLTPLFVLETLTVLLAYLLQSRRQTWLAVGASVFGLLVNVTLNVVLDPNLADRGAAISATVTELILTVVLLIIVKVNGFRLPDSDTPLPVAITAP